VGLVLSLSAFSLFLNFLNLVSTAFPVMPRTWPTSAYVRDLVMYSPFLSSETSVKSRMQISRSSP
jgi:hypothetical protein